MAPRYAAAGNADFGTGAKVSVTRARCVVYSGALFSVADAYLVFISFFIYYYII